VRHAVGPPGRPGRHPGVSRRSRSRCPAGAASRTPA
jgi:hypothetical protein